MKYLSKFAVLSFLLLSILISSSQAQVDGSIEGYVLDSKTQEALPGANVQLKGTSIGAATDLQGKFIINQVSPGEYQLVITYIGYHEKILDISVTAGQKLEENIALDYQSLEGETIVVTAQAEGQAKSNKRTIGFEHHYKYSICRKNPGITGFKRSTSFKPIARTFPNERRPGSNKRYSGKDRILSW